MKRLVLKFGNEMALLAVLDAALSGQPVSTGREVAVRLARKIRGRLKHWDAVGARLPPDAGAP